MIDLHFHAVPSSGTMLVGVFERWYERLDQAANPGLITAWISYYDANMILKHHQRVFV